MVTYRLRQWSVVLDNDPYAAPEVRGIMLKGYRDDETDHHVITSKVMKVEGRKVTTRNSVYLLEDIEPEYLQWMKDNNVPYDDDVPIRIKMTKMLLKTLN